VSRAITLFTKAVTMHTELFGGESKIFHTFMVQSKIKSKGNSEEFSTNTTTCRNNNSNAALLWSHRNAGSQAASPQASL
jgi:hypothetical protein